MSATSIEPSGSGSGSAYVTIADGTATAQYTAATDGTFRSRLAIIAPLVASAMMNESSAANSRGTYAVTVLADPVSVIARSIAYLVAADGITGPSSTDQQIANRLGDVWNDLSRSY